MRKILLLTALLAGGTHSAQAALGIGLKGGFSFNALYYNFWSSTSTYYTPYTAGWGGGLVLDIGNPLGQGVLIDAQYMVRRLTSVGGTISSFNWAVLPVQFRFYTQYAFVSVGIYGAKAIGPVKDSAGGSQSYQSAGFYDYDAGFVIAGGLAMGQKSKFTMEMRFYYGILDASRNTVAYYGSGALHWSSIDLLLGFIL